jgi:hypothetical protein
MIHHFEMDAEAISSLMGTTIFVVDHQQWNLGPKSTGVDGLDNRFEIASIAGGHHPNPQRWYQGSNAF